LGLDVYLNTWYGNVVGFQGTYKYMLPFDNRSFKFFADMTLQTSKFGVGTGQVTPYNFTPIDSFASIYVLLKSKSFVHTFGMGVNVKVTKRVGLQLTASVGYNVCKSEFSSSNTEQHELALYKSGTKFLPVAYLRAGVFAKLWKTEKRAI
jgi:hypothetical protein